MVWQWTTEVRPRALEAALIRRLLVRLEIGIIPLYSVNSFTYLLFLLILFGPVRDSVQNSPHASRMLEENVTAHLSVGVNAGIGARYREAGAELL